MPKVNEKDGFPYECLSDKCKHNWIAMIKKPVQCPRCHSKRIQPK